MKNKLALKAGVIGAALSGFLFMATSSFAQTLTPTPPTMDADVQSQLTATLAGIVTALKANFVYVLLAAGSIILVVMVVHWVLGQFKGMVKH